MKLSIILHNIRSAHNVGSIFRTADAVGVEKIYLGGYTPTPAAQFPISNFQFSKTDKIAKTALGAEKVVSWEQHQQAWRLLEKLKKEGVQIVALEQNKKAIDYRKFKPNWPMALVLGNEVGGLSRKILKYCDKIIAIPMHGQKESLNVAVAFGIAAFKIREQV